MADEKKPSPVGTFDERVAVDQIWNLLARDAVLPESITEWPGVNALAVRDELIPAHDPSAGPMPIGFAYFLLKDLRDLRVEFRVDRAARYISEPVLATMNQTWINILHAFLVIYTGCKHPRTGRGINSRMKAVINNLEGLDLHPENVEKHDASKDEDSNLEQKTQTGDRAPTIMDLQNAVKTMTGLFPEDTRPTGEESEPFTSRLEPIVEQMETLGFAPIRRPSVLFSLLMGPARKACKRLKLHSLSLHEMIDEVKRKVLFDGEIKDRRVTTCTSVTFDKFRKIADCEENATRRCLEFVVEYQKDLPKHMLAEEHLYSRIRSIFRSVPWCETLFQRTEAHENATSFGQKLISAAANYDMRATNQPKSIAPFDASQPTISCAEKKETPWSELIAFFSNTPPPPRHRCPSRFNQSPYSRFCNRPFNRGNQSSTRPSWMRPPALQRSHSRPGKVCFGCKQEGHFLRDCPQRDRYKRRFQYFCDISDAAAYFLAHEDHDVDNSGHEVLTYFADAEEQLFHVEEQHEEADDVLDAWIADMFAVLDKSYLSRPALPLSINMDQNSYGFISLSIPELKGILETLTLFSNNSAVQHLLLDTGAPRSICSEEWLQKAKWEPLKKIELPSNTPPFRFAGHPVCALYGVQLAAKIMDLEGKDHILKIFAYVLPSTPIPFLLGLTDQRRLGFDICLRERHSSHLRISAWHKIFPLMVTSHVWLHFSPVHRCSPESLDWNDIIEKSMLNKPAAMTQGVTHTMTCIVVPDSNVLSDNGNATYLIPPWRRDTWTPTLSRFELFRLHRALKHPETSSMSKVLRKSLGDKPLPLELRQELESMRCSECAETLELPGKPKLSIPLEATPNIIVSLDVMQHKIRNKPADILVMLDHGDLLMRLKTLPDRTASAAFNSFYSRWISIFDALTYVLVDRGSNLAAELMKEKLHEVEAQLCPIPTEAPWGIGLNERSHRYLHKSIDRLLLQTDYEPGHELEVLLADVEVGWNFAQHTNNILPHYNLFGIMPRLIGSLDKSPRLMERIALMHLAREETDTLRARDFLARALDKNRRTIVAIKSFSIKEKVWLHRHRHGWRTGTVASIDPPTIMIEFEGKLYPTHATRVRPYFGELSVPPSLRGEQVLPDRPHTTLPQAHRRAPISDIINTIFVSSHTPEITPFAIAIPSTSYSISISKSDTCDIDSDSVFLTVTKVMRDHKSLSEADKKSFEIAKRGEIDFLLKDAVTPIPLYRVPNEVELQFLKWVLAVKSSSEDVSATRHRARLVSASHKSVLRHSVHGNAPTIMLSTLCLLTSILPTWMKLSKNDRIIVFCRDVTKAYLQSFKSERLILYRPPEEFFDAYPQFHNHVWRANIQLYGEVEAGLYWHKTLVPWLVENIPDLQQSIFDPSLLFSPTKLMAILLCTDDTFVAIPESLLSSEAAIEKRFECRDRQFLPSDFKGVDVIREGPDIVLSQLAYLDTKGKPQRNEKSATKRDLHRELTDEEASEHRTAAGRLAWIGTGTSPTSACMASIALQGKKKTVAILNSCHEAYEKVFKEKLASLRYVPLDFTSIHIRVFSDGSFQNLPDKHLQIGFVFVLADGHDQSNIFHWHSSRATRRPASTEEAELLALDIALLRLRNQRRVMFQLLQKEVPTVLYIDNQTLWQNLMNTTAPSMPEVMYRCREQITDEVINSVCLIESKFNPADAMTKKHPNHSLASLIRTNELKVPCKRVFMLQHSIYRNTSFIPTSQVLMQGDIDVSVNLYQDTPILPTTEGPVQEDTNFILSHRQDSVPDSSN